MRFLLLSIIGITVHSSTAQFQLLAQSNQQNCKWMIKNTSSDSLRVTSASIRFFHMTGDVVFTPSISNPGGGKYQYQGVFNSNGKYNFHYKTIQITTLDSMMQPGDQTLISTTENTGTRRDTIIAADVIVYFKNANGDTSAQVFPGGIAPCPSTSVFISAGNTNYGIKLGSQASPNLHFGVCETQLVAVVFDNNTLNRKAVSGASAPHCAGGRKWTSFGNSTDSQVYYTFDITTSLGRSQFDSFINAINTGDYVAMTNTAIIDISNLNPVLNTMKKVGFEYSSFGSIPGYFNVLGKKSVNPGEAAYNYCTDSHAVCFISLEQIMTSGDKTNVMLDYSTCYENIAQTLEVPVSGVSDAAVLNLNLYPNPTGSSWMLTGKLEGTAVVLTDIAGRVLNQFQGENEMQISAESLPSGLYLISVQQPNGQKTTIRGIKN